MTDEKVAVAVPRRKDGKYLFLKRAPEMRSPGIWTFPGGKIRENESPSKAALRELEEETGLEGQILKSADKFYQKVREREHEMYFFLVEIKNEEVRLNHEHTDYEWINLSEMKEFKTLGNNTGLRKLGLTNNE